MSILIQGVITQHKLNLIVAYGIQLCTSPKKYALLTSPRGRQSEYINPHVPTQTPE